MRLRWRRKWSFLDLSIPASMHQASALGLASSSEGQKWRRRSPATEQRCLEMSLENTTFCPGGWQVIGHKCKSHGCSPNAMDPQLNCSLTYVGFLVQQVFSDGPVATCHSSILPKALTPWGMKGQQAKAFWTPLLWDVPLPSLLLWVSLYKGQTMTLILKTFSIFTSVELPWQTQIPWQEQLLSLGIGKEESEWCWSEGEKLKELECGWRDTFRIWM